MGNGKKPTTMTFKNHKISSQLDKYIESIFYYKDFVPEHNIEKVIPTGNIFILIELDGFERKTFDNELESIGHFRNSWISGMHQKHLNISAHKNSEMLIIQFKSFGAYPFLKLPINELNNKVVQAEKYFGDSILKLREAIILKQSISDKFKIVEEWLLGIFDEKGIPPKEIIDFMKTLQSQPFSKHNELLKDYPKTSKNLIDQLKKYCGLTPKVFHRIFRFNTLLTNINQKKEIVWTDIVYETGYSDQSHFIKEFQEFSGFNPTQFIKNGYNDSVPNFLPLDK